MLSIRSVRALAIAFLFSQVAFAMGAGADSPPAPKPVAKPVAEKALTKPKMHPATAGRATITALDRRVEGMRTMSEYFPSRSITRSGAVHAFGSNPTPAKDLTYEHEGVTYDARQFAERNHTTSLVIVHDGVVVHEQYLQGADETTRLTSYSMAKSLVSLLAGFAVGDGAIASLDDPVTKYVPELAGTGYDGATVKDLLQMSSGVRFSEGYKTGGSDIYRLSGASMVMNEMPANQFMTTLPRDHEPGTHFNYSTGETQVLGWVVASAVGRSLSDYIEEKLWSKLGMEHDAYWVLDRNGGDEFCGIGFNATARDYARIGQLMLQDGVWEGTQLLPKGWVKASTTPGAPYLGYGKVLEGQPAVGYGYMWWLRDDGTYDAEGVFGQFIWVNPADRIVIVKTSAWPSGISIPLKTELFEAFGAFSDHFAGR